MNKLFLPKQAGNPAAVCLLENDIGDDLKQRIAAEMNLSETAFLVPIAAQSKEDPFKTESR